ncbi:MAG: SDR family oxidoreductase [Fidelibacterota bacterium]
MNLNLKGKRALVCGSTDGIGKATAQLLAERGASIILAARNQEKIVSVMHKLSGHGHSFICADFNDPDDLMKKAENHINDTGPVHILINNTGGPKGGPLIEGKAEEFQAAFNRHVISNQFLAQVVVPGMKELGHGRIINIISMSVMQVIPGLGISNTIRGAVAQWAKTLALELGEYDITVNNILPGYTDTDRLKDLLQNQAKENGIRYDEMVELTAKKVSLRRIGQPEETASAIAFLASDASGYITGADFPVDGARFGL